LGCGAILYCSLNPELTQSLSQWVGNRTNSDASDENAADTDGAILNDIVSAAGDVAQQVTAVYPAEGNSDSDTYQSPDSTNVSAPDKVNGRNGYEPVSDEQEQIEDKDAQSLKKQLSTGSLGDDLSFDAETYPYYAMLDDKLKSIYRQIYANANNLVTSFAPAEEVSTTELKTAFEAFFNDHPEIFWIQTSYSCKHTQNGNCVEVTLKYYPIVNNLETAKTSFEQQAQNIINGASGYTSDYEKEKYVHDALLGKVDYVESSDMNQSAYSALVNGKSVCAGYARAFQYCMQKLGIPTYYCTGYSGGDHAWNIVKLADGYYNVDVTWDDTDPATYDYFNKSDADYAKTHVRQSLSVNLPACNGKAYAYSGSGTPETVQIPEDAAVTEKHMEPLTWHDSSVSSGDAADKTEESQALKKAGVKQSDVITTLDAYYNNCYTQLVNLGSGDRQFTNVVTYVEWIVIEQEYTSGRYEAGYVKEALKKLGMDRFAIQIQAENLGDGYYRLYHNVVTWND
jgi:hypothetical protein